MNRRDFFHTLAGLGIFTAGCLLCLLKSAGVPVFTQAKPHPQYPGTIKSLGDITEDTEMIG